MGGILVKKSKNYQQKCEGVTQWGNEQKFCKNFVKFVKGNLIASDYCM